MNTKKEIDDLQAYLGIYRDYLQEELSREKKRIVNICQLGKKPPLSTVEEERCLRAAIRENTKRPAQTVNSLKSILLKVDSISTSLRYQANEGNPEKSYIDLSIAVSKFKNLIECYCW